MPSQTQFIAPLTGTPRPSLPLEHLNPHIKSIDSSNLPNVKFQEIIREGQSTIVARMKVPTPTGHAFILRRLDTGAISLTTMFRAAFPTASDESERLEANWVKANFDNSAGNRTGKARFAGTWVAADIAINIADQYSLGNIILSLTDAKPDPNTEYRKSSRAQQQTPDKGSPAPKQLPTPSPSMSVPNPPKRRREASPAPTKPPSVAASSPTKSSLSPISTRRSQRTTSPAPLPTPKLVGQKVVSTPKSPKVSRSPVKTRRLEVVTPAGSDETAVDDDVAEVPGPDINEDIREQKEIIEAFKAQREANLQEQVAGDEDEVMDDQSEKKRDREDENRSLQFNFKEPETQERKIATNKRISRLPEMTPQRRSFAWGVAAFAAAVSAMTYLPLSNPWF
ncbi:hypothetical protein B0F90DRAFT_1709452 [Multifurca ochricompacta]|uniref:HTH APSES-type domain-containing protein n=1 Tax=Multifurca ochricompacta TaxID=376703 RepID=A0AAD4QNQ5_9AGAM|nr:hypothetical protein B0F90DRAFT_1709452 [Multifurca ochricompacta]